MLKMGNNFFSISSDFILIDKLITYNLYVNSSVSESKQHFVQIYPKDESLSFEELQIFKKKYLQFYVHETEREAYLKSLIEITNKNVTNLAKADVIKTSAIHYLDKLFESNKEFNNEILAETIKGCKTSVEAMVDFIKDNYTISTLQSLIANLSFHDFYTYDHSINVSMYCILLFNAIKPDAEREEIVLAGLGGLLHDIGKIKIPTDIINKPEKLNAEELALIGKHPEYGRELLEESNCNCEGVDLEIIKRIVYEHHESFNGAGYPRKISGHDIHLFARITAIADFFDAITTKRSYHQVLSTEDALILMAKSSGKKLDSELFKIFSKGIVEQSLLNSGNKELDESFDPCQPQNVLPFKIPQAFTNTSDFDSVERTMHFKKIKRN